MDRRTVLRRTALAAGLSVSGCLGYDLVDANRMEGLEERVSNQSAEIEDLQSQLDSARADLEAAESDLENLAAERAAERVDVLATLYDQARSLADDALQSRNDAVSLWNAEQYRLSYAESLRGEQRGQTAEAILDEVVARCEEFGYSSPATMAGRAAEYARLLKQANERGKRAAAMVISGEGSADRINEHIDAGNARTGEAREVDVPEPSAFRSALDSAAQ